MRAEFLDGLPSHSIVTDRDHTAWQKQNIAGLDDTGTAWVHAIPHGIVLCPDGATLLSEHGPIQLITTH